MLLWGLLLCGQLLGGWVCVCVGLLSFMLLCFAIAEMWGSNLYEAIGVCIYVYVCVCVF